MHLKVWVRVGKSQRIKGASGEREACEALAPLYPDLKRGLIQTRGGSECPDIDSPECEFWIEVKRGAKAPHPSPAYEQALKASDGRPPLVLTRKDRSEWLVTMSLESFLKLAKRT